MTLRTSKILLVFGIAILYTPVVFNNLTDYDLSVCAARANDGLDVPGNHGMWRAINAPALHTAFYVVIIAWESVTMILCWWAGLALLSTRHSEPADVPCDCKPRASLSKTTENLHI